MNGFALQWNIGKQNLPKPDHSLINPSKSLYIRKWVMGSGISLLCSQKGFHDNPQWASVYL